MAPNGRKTERMEDFIMKYRNMNRYWSLNLQLFAEGDGGDPGADGNDDDAPDVDPDSDPDGDDDDGDPNSDDEKIFSQKDMDDTIKKRLAREKRKWQREQQKKAEQNKPDGQGKTGENKDDDEETQELRRKAERVDDLELKWTCLEHDVDKSCVDDVLALAKVHMAKDEELDIEDAIDQVLKKYPQFKEASSQDDDDTNDGKGKAWGQRHGKPVKKQKSLDDEISAQLFGK